MTEYRDAKLKEKIRDIGRINGHYSTEQEAVEKGVKYLKRILIGFCFNRATLSEQDVSTRLQNRGIAKNSSEARELLDMMAEQGHFIYGVCNSFSVKKATDGVGNLRYRFSSWAD